MQGRASGPWKRVVSGSVAQSKWAVQGFHPPCGQQVIWPDTACQSLKKTNASSSNHLPPRPHDYSIGPSETWGTTAMQPHCPTMGRTSLTVLTGFFIGRIPRSFVKIIRIHHGCLELEKKGSTYAAAAAAAAAAVVRHRVLISLSY